MNPGPTGRIVGFPPSVDRRTRVLILGSAPSVASLACREYYGHPRNQFWSIIEALFGIRRQSAHAARLRALRDRGVGLWDVVHSCRRVASSDASIEAVEPNDLPAVLRSCPRLAAICFNGAKAEQLFRRLVEPAVGPPVRQLLLERLPSTSPANASLRPEAKLRAWQRLRALLAADQGA